MNKPLRTKTTISRRPKVVLDERTLSRLEAMAEAAYSRNPMIADLLLDELGRARIVPTRKVPNDVVAIGRNVTYRDETTGEEKTVTPVYPEDADISVGKISVMTPIGVALIGLAQGAKFAWQTRSGEVRELSILNVADVACAAPNEG
ncbi:nucleoside diphosphate kinase regulator [Pseudooceanicola nitratireducens]|uniref:nucleoside diphosphate kinase regulator n=1 Tax=Pseudooceanicola nitratireducens TaxID=517719 RepID=UPI001C97D912|nr:nucleoside diphosphate kinase regulator [Pseudooceanicola nitratireducens]MBY6158993.1 nucleoside diphosphate kinase regulator [Pseudooceanicola nitratireducens]MEC7297055.1 nucleoside diphosphate kinase regulator [Pseudomonadota bacterium]